jgi:pimeloyl-ACP methyl ester carboxylesterase
LYRDVLDDLRAHRDRLDMEEAARRLDAPLLIVHGSEDEAVPVAEAHALHRTAGTAELAIIEGAGHTMSASHPFPGTNPHLEEAVWRTISHFEEHLMEEQE